MTALLISSDLMTFSQFSAAAAQRARPVVLAASAAAAVDKLAESPCTLVAIDLTTANLDLAALVTACKSAAPGARVVAFGPHVHEALLAAAAAAGCDDVLPRGQFLAQLGRIVAAGDDR